MSMVPCGCCTCNGNLVHRSTEWRHRKRPRLAYWGREDTKIAAEGRVHLEGGEESEEDDEGKQGDDDGDFSCCNNERTTPYRRNMQGVNT